MRAKLEQDLLKLQEDELELDDERKYHALLSVSCSLFNVRSPRRERTTRYRDESNPGRSSRSHCAKLTKAERYESPLLPIRTVLIGMQDPHSCPQNMTNYHRESRSW